MTTKPESPDAGTLFDYLQWLKSIQPAPSDPINAEFIAKIDRWIAEVSAISASAGDQAVAWRAPHCGEKGIKNSNPNFYDVTCSECRSTSPNSTIWNCRTHGTNPIDPLIFPRDPLEVER